MNTQAKKTTDSPETAPAFQQIQKTFTDNIRDPENTPSPEGIEERRMAIYRELVYNNIEDLLSNFFPVLNKILPERRWHQIVREFVIKHKSQTPVFMELAREFVTYLQQGHCPVDTDPLFLLELAHYEWLEVELQTAQHDIVFDNVDIHGDLLAGVPVPSPLFQLATYQYPVHKIGPGYCPTEPQLTFLVVYRDKNDEVRFMELNPMAARLLVLLMENFLTGNEQPNKLPGRKILEKVAEQLRHLEVDTVIESGLQIMQQWQQRDILLGTLLDD